MYVLCGKLNFTSISEICEGGADLLACPRTVLDFLKIKFEKSSSTNWIFNLQKLIYLQKSILKIQSEIDEKSSSSNLIFQKSSTDG